jgi:hypothetical protein
MATFFLDGGPVMILTTLFGFLLAGASVLAALRPARSWRVVVVLGFATGVSGVLGTSLGLVSTLRYAAHAASEEGAITTLRIVAVGIAESLNNAILASVIILMSLGGCAVAAVRRRRAQAADGR